MKNTKQQIKSIFTFIIVATLIAILPTACHKRHCDDDYDNGKLMIEDVSITQPIKGVIIEGPWDVSITQDDTNNSAHLEYSESMKNKVKAEQLSNGYLRIKITYTGNFNHKTFRANIVAANLEKIDGSGATNIWCSGNYLTRSDISLSGASTLEGFMCKGEYVKFKLSGASTLKGFTFEGNWMEADLTGASHLSGHNVITVDDYCNVDCGGSSTFDARGFAPKTEFTGSGASSYKTFNFESENLDIDLSGASLAEVTVNNTIKGRLSGASHLKYKRATDVSGVHLSGSSTITKID
jgi:hypothetical protein